jgi:hypothetical protein
MPEKFNKFLILVLALSSLVNININCQENNPLQEWGNKIYKEDIKTMLIYKSGWELSMPVIELNSDEKITLSFDEINQSRKNYSYTVIHCDNKWQQSEIAPIEYIDGQEFGTIDDYDFSQNTLFDYINYHIDFPTENTKLLLSGNYIIKVFEDDDPSKILLTARFYVVEKKIGISAYIDKRTLPGLQGQNQYLNFQIKYNESEIINPYESLRYKILKNNETELDFNELKPTSIFQNTMKFENLEKLAFTGGNEYRHLDTKSFKFLSDCLEKIDKKDNVYIVTIKTDFNKSDEEYKLETDLNGKRTVKLENNDESYMMADYCYVNFELSTDLPLEEGNYYIFGSLSNFSISDEFKMSYNMEKKVFEKQILLKQGYYNYKYAFVPNNKKFDNEENRYRTEGNYFQTENDFHIFTYYKPYNQNYYSLVGYSYTNSSKQ